MSPKAKAWLGAIRLRTLPLAGGGIILASFLPEVRIAFNPVVLLTALFTATGLQILSNLANDYGDFQKGTDNAKRIGPTRALQSGLISMIEMKRAMRFFVFFSLISGIVLLSVAFTPNQIIPALMMFALGLTAIWAALRYTVGEKAYGYQGLGDVFVILFFGLVSVWGVSFLHLGALHPAILFPALGYGLLSAGVLNINNMRDIDNDRDSGKHTLVVKLGANKARIYHALLIFGALGCFFFYLDGQHLTVCFESGKEGVKEEYRYLALLGFLPIFYNTFLVLKKKNHPKEYNPYLKGLSLSILFLVVFFSLVLNYLIA